MMFDKFRDECGVFGIFGHPEASNHAYLGLYALQHRGRELRARRTARPPVGEPAGEPADLVRDARDVPDDDVGLLAADRVEQVPAAELHRAAQAERLRVLPRDVDRVFGQVGPDHAAGAQARRHERQDPAAAPDVDHGVVGADLQGVGDRAACVRGMEDAVADKFLKAAHAKYPA